jgi:hypothetical protein
VAPELGQDREEARHYTNRRKPVCAGELAQQRGCDKRGMPAAKNSIRERRQAEQIVGLGNSREVVMAPRKRDMRQHREAPTSGAGSSRTKRTFRIRDRKRIGHGIAAFIRLYSGYPFVMHTHMSLQS